MGVASAVPPTSEVESVVTSVCLGSHPPVPHLKRRRRERERRLDSPQSSLAGTGADLLYLVWFFTSQIRFFGMRGSCAS